MCRFLVFDRLGKNGSLWGGQNLTKTCTQKFENGHISSVLLKFKNK